MGSIKCSGGAYTWPQVPVIHYEGDSAQGATKQVLIGARDGAENFALRYFEIPVGQASAHEHHPHDHGVVITRGKAQVLLGEDWHDIAAGDVVYVGSDEQHQFKNTGDEPLCFFCIVPAWGEKQGGELPK